MTPYRSSPVDETRSEQGLVGLHRRFHGRWSGLALAVGMIANLAGLLGLADLASRS